MMHVFSTVVTQSRYSISGAATLPESRLMMGLVLGPRRWGEGVERCGGYHRMQGKSQAWC